MNKINYFELMKQYPEAKTMGELEFLAMKNGQELTMKSVENIVYNISAEKEYFKITLKDGTRTNFKVKVTIVDYISWKKEISTPLPF